MGKLIMKHLFVPYEIARQLKEKGFNEPCIASFEDHLDTGTQHLYPLVNWHNIEGVKPLDVPHTICAPLYQQVIDWFRDKHGIVIELTYGSNINKETGFKYHLRMDTNFNSKIGVVFPYYEALTKAIEAALKLL